MSNTHSYTLIWLYKLIPITELLPISINFQIVLIIKKTDWNGYKSFLLILFFQQTTNFHFCTRSHTYLMISFNGTNITCSMSWEFMYVLNLVHTVIHKNINTKLHLYHSNCFENRFRQLSVATVFVFWREKCYGTKAKPFFPPPYQLQSKIFPSTTLSADSLKKCTLY